LVAAGEPHVQAGLSFDNEVSVVSSFFHVVFAHSDASELKNADEEDASACNLASFATVM
jgi:hypothetical protein